jgi:hypothetical protein
VHVWPEPEDTTTVHRMRTAHTHACATLGCRPVPNAREVWGWHGRTLGKPVTTPNGPIWLRLAHAPIDQIIDTFWNGSIDAAASLPVSIPRPALRAWHDWTHQQHAYRAELHQYLTGRPISDAAVLTTNPFLPAQWWAQLRTALADIAMVKTKRTTIQQGFLDWAMPHYLGEPVNTRSPAAWTTAHGDLHYANLCATPDLQILDWEGWGQAPAGYDAAVLHSHSLLTPQATASIRDYLGHLLNNPTGRFAELAALTELLHNTTDEPNQPLQEAVHKRASQLLGRSVPT